MGSSTESIKFFLDGREIEALVGETIWQAAKRHAEEIPYLCYSPEPDYKASGNCRACMVEIEGERVLAASCVRQPTAGMKVKSSSSERAQKSRKLVFELLAADQPPRDSSYDKNAPFWQWADKLSVDQTRFTGSARPAADYSHTAIAVNMDACISCRLCVQACRDIQVNDVIGLGQRGHSTRVVFDFDDPMGASSCVSCGECVQICPTGALQSKSMLDSDGVGVFATGQTAHSEVPSVCPYCGVGCQITYHIQDDQIVSVEGRNGPSSSGRLCVKGRFGFDYIHHPDRLSKPLIRREDVAKTSEVEFDPANPGTHFREATWEEALDRAAEGLNRLRKEHGPRALAGFGSAKGSNEEAYLFQKLVRAGFGSNNVDHCTRLCHASSVAALMEGISSGAVTAPFMEAMNAEVIITIGCNPESNHPVAANLFKQAVRRGVKLVVMDPRGHSLKKHATHMLQFNAGADVSLLNAIMHVIVEEKLVDQSFLDNRTIGFDALAEHLHEFSPERMAPICGIDAATITTVARLYANAKSAMIFWGMGVSQHAHGTDNARCLIALAMLTGHVGKPGSGLHPLRGQNNVQGASDAGLIPMFFPDYKRVGDDQAREHLETLWSADLDDQPGLTVVEIMDAIHLGEIRGMYIMGENPAMSDPDINHARKALASLEHLVVQDLFLTETAIYADVILPASAWPEKDGTVSSTNRQVQLGRAALPLPGDARQDWQLIQEIARRMGLDWNYQHPRDVFAEMHQAMPSLTNITWERLQRESSITYPCPAPDHPGNAVVFGDRFPSATGKATLVPAGIIPPHELPDAEYPLVLSTGRVLEHWHTGSMTRRSAILNDLEPEAIVTLNGSECQRLGIVPGEMIEVVGRRGTARVKVRLDDGVADGCLFMPFCYAEGAANKLTNPALDPFGKIPEFKFCAVRVEKSE
jgi:formate dehydrogenase major subunit|tara:strand:+ start:1925 stop:4699 length:2775 start_codon:yes stop_codon:yes gene_type:complete